MAGRRGRDQRGDWEEREGPKGWLGGAGGPESEGVRKKGGALSE